MRLTERDIERREFAKKLLSKNDYGACVDVFNEFAQRGDLVSAAALGEIYFRGGNGVLRDYIKSRYWLEKVAHFVFTPDSAYKLGLIYYRGLGVNIDFKVAYSFFRKLALARMPRGLVMVGVMHRNREGVIFKPRLAQTCFRAALKNKDLNIVERFSVTWMLVAGCISAK